MLQINCPLCGPRNENEFINGGNAEKRRPISPSDLTDKEWTNYLYTAPNTRGWIRENWWHVRGCRRWIQMERNTVTHEMKSLSVDNYENG